MKIEEEKKMELKYQKLDGGGDEENKKGGEKGIGEEATKESEEEGCGHESVYFTRRSRRRHVHEVFQIQHQVACVR